MAITRIKNNQITDASAGNIFLGVNAAVKLQDYSITSGKIANDLTYNSSLTITGNLTVQGNTTTIDTTNLVVEDPIIILASEQTGTPALDIGFIGERGDSENITFVWDESADTFVAAFTNDLVTNTTVSISSYADFKANNVVANGTFTANGTSTLVGNTSTGNLAIDASKVFTIGANSTTDFNLINLSNVADPVGAQDVATKSYVDTSLSSIFTLEDDASNTTTVADGDTVQMLGTANEVDVVVGNLSVTFGLPDDVTIGNTLTVTDEVNATGNISGGNLAIGNAITAGTTIVATGNITGGNIDTSGQIIALGNITGANLDIGNGITAGTTIVAVGNIDGNNINASNAITAGTTIDATGNITGGNIITSGLVDATGNVNAGNINTGGQVIATGNVSGGNITTTGNIDGNNINASNAITAGTTIDAIGNITGGNITTAGITDTGSLTANTTIDAIGNITGGNIITTGVVQTGTLETTGNALIGGNLIVNGNITYINIDDLRVEDPIIILGTGPNGAPLTVDDGKDRGVFMEYFISGIGNAFMGFDNSTGNMIIANDAFFTGNDVVGINAYGTLEVGNIYGESAVFVGNVNAGNLISEGAVIGNVEITGNLELGNLSATGVIDATGNITGGNLVTGNLVSGANVQVTSLTANRVVYVGTDDYLVDSANFTYDGTQANIIGNLDVQGTTVLDNFTIDGTSITSNANLTITSSSDGNVDVTPNGTGVVNIDNITIADNTIGSSTGNIVLDPAANIVLPDETASAVLYVNANNEVETSSNFTYDGTQANIVGNLDVQGTTILDNFTIDGTSITSNANLTITSSADGNVDVTPNGTGVVNIDNITIADNTIGSSTGNIVLDPSGTINLPDEIANAILYTGEANQVSTDANLTYNGSDVQLLNGNIKIGDAVANVFVTNEGIQGTGTLVINQDSSDVDFAVNGDTNANIFYIDAGTETASFGNATQTTNAIVSFNATNSILIPIGNSAQRPDTPVTGMVRFNTTLDNLEFYDSDSWVSAGSVFTLIDSEVFNGDGSTVTFTLNSDQTTDSCIVSINGVLQIPVVAYAVSGNVMTFTEAPLSQDVIEVRQLTTTVTVRAISNSSGNALIEVEDISSNVYITGNITPTSNIAYNLGSPTNRFNEIYLAGSSIYLGNLILKNTSGNTFAFFGPDGTTPGTLDSNNVDTTSIANGTANVRTFSSDNTATISAGGQANVAVISSTGANIAGILNATGNVIGGNLNTAGRVVATGNVTGGNITTAGLVTATGNITGGNLVTTGNVQAGNLLVSGIEAVTTLSVTGDTLISGNLTVSGSTITANVSSIVVTDPILALGRGANGDPLVSNDGLDRGTEMFYYNTAERIAFMGFDNSEGKMLSAANVSIANNVVTVNNFGTTTVGTLETSGIVNTNANGVGNIGSNTTFFNTVFAKATSAQYADLAEMYEADAAYEPGTVVCFGGAKEVTLCNQADCTRVAGVISTNPSYLMNSGQEGDNVVAVALQGRVPCKVTGIIRKGDLIVSTGDGRGCANNDARVGTVIGKALADFDGADGVIEVVVGRV